MGVNVNNIDSMTEPQQDALIALLPQHGVKTVRIGIGGKFNHFIIGADRVGIGTLAGVSPTVASRARWHRVGSATHAPWVGPSLTDADPEKFKAWLAAALAPLETAGVSLTGFELGNEINLSGENGDLPVLPRARHVSSGSRISTIPTIPTGVRSPRVFARICASWQRARTCAIIQR